MTDATRAALRAMPRWPIYLGVSVLLLTAIPTLLHVQPPLLLQLTGSEPPGVYCLRPLPAVLTTGLLVTLPVPPSVEDLVFGQGWLPRSWMGAEVVLVKTIAALAGDAVCLDDTGVWINGVWQASVSRELGGVALPVIRGCWTLADGEVFLFSKHLDRAFDGRYWGLSSRTQLQRVAVPLWTWSHT
jgi:type IV secretory pathway protease TraF